ncbi:MAG TPA: VOC family protein [Verrucomicrobiae bacterium]|nr:VOC family protein [Verrucomicrobiae bacterium]
MKTQVYPYLNFKDNARQAMEFYQSVFGGKLDIATFKEYADMPQDPADGDKVMNAMLQADSVAFMAADTPSSMEYTPGNNFAMALSGDNEQELRGFWDKLAEGGTVVMPLDTAPWGDVFGMVVDGFGVQWMVDIAKQS